LKKKKKMEGHVDESTVEGAELMRLYKEFKEHSERTSYKLKEMVDWINGISDDILSTFERELKVEEEEKMQVPTDEKREAEEEVDMQDEVSSKEDQQDQ
jgi:hypothetical protein